ncbi:hypothetical protein BC830DRAFT_1158482 [Chytriomyces sp. MP71]|nr:hypothetical protein BC830DRAFT_1158482 [Chytriomyces sp. MP71]
MNDAALHGQPQPPSALHSPGTNTLIQVTPIDEGIQQQKKKRGRPRKTLLLSSPIKEPTDGPARAHRRPAQPLNTHSLFASMALAAIPSSDSSEPSGDPPLTDWCTGIPGLTPLDDIYSPSHLLYSVHVPNLASRGPSTFSHTPVAQLRRHPNARNLRTVYHSMMELADVSHAENTTRPKYFPDLSDSTINFQPTANPLYNASREGQSEIVGQSVPVNSADHIVKLDPSISETPSISSEKQPLPANRTQPTLAPASLGPHEQTPIVPTPQEQKTMPQSMSRAPHQYLSDSQPPVSPPSKLPTPTTSPLNPKRSTPNSASGGGLQPPASPSGRQKRVRTLAAKSAALTTALAALRAQREREQQHAEAQGAVSLSGSLHDIAGGLRRFVSEVNGSFVPATSLAEMQPALVEHLQTLKGAGKFAVPPGQVASAIKKRRIEAIDAALGLIGAAEADGRKREEMEMDGERISGTEREGHDVVVKQEGGEGLERRRRTTSGKRSQPKIALPDGMVLSSGSERRKRTRSGDPDTSSSCYDAYSTKLDDAGMTGGMMDATALLSSAAELLNQTEAAEALAAATLSGQSLSVAELADLHSVPSSPVSNTLSDGGQSGLELLALLAAAGTL